MKHKILLLAAILAFTLTGCQLARPEAEIESTGDRLVGIYVTTEPLNLADSEAMANMGPDQIDPQNSDWKQRFYAEPVTKTATSDDGETTQYTDYVFPATGAALYFTMGGEDDNRYYSSHGDDAMLDVHYASGSYDGREENSLSGTVAVVPGAEERFVYFHPIYQQEDGQVYVISESGFGFCIGDSNQCEGEVYGHKLSEKTTITIDNAETDAETTVEVTVTVMFAPESVTVVQFDKSGIALRETAFRAGEAPDQIVLDAGAAYLIVETVKADPAGGAMTTREIFGRDTETLSAYYAREDGLCAAQFVDLLWPEEGGETP